METVVVKRHSLFYRLVHWSIVFSGIILGLTGLQLGGLYNFKILDGHTYALHVFVGLIFGALWILFFYYIIVHEWKWFSLSRIPYSLKFLIAETLAWFEIGSHIEDPRGYNPEKKEYVEKLIPTEVMVWWMYLALAMLMGITGLAMIYQTELSFVFDIAAKIGALFGTENGYAVVRLAHRIGMYLFLMVMIIHAYAVIIFDVLGSMITGKRAERVRRE